MMRFFLFVFGLSYVFSSCSAEEYGDVENALLDVNLSVMDMDNQPLKDIEVVWTSPSTNKNVYKTNEKGQFIAHLIGPSSSTTNSVFNVNDTLDFKAVNRVETPYSYSPIHKRITLYDTIRMDRIEPISLRFISNRANRKTLNIQVLKEPEVSNRLIRRTFYEKTILLSNSTPLDTTIKVNAFAKTAFSINAYLTVEMQPVYISKKLLIADFAKRDTVFVFEF